MSLDHHLDCDVKLSTDNEHSSLYAWCIREFDENGNQIGQDQIPWPWPQRFGITNLRYHFSLEHDEYASRSVPDQDTEEQKNSSISGEIKEIIYADLTPINRSSGSMFPTTYSMFGTKRNINSFHLRLIPSDEEYCSLFGIVSYTSEVDFRDITEDDVIEISLAVSREKFERFRNLIERQSVTEGYISLEHVSGFYSDWSPSISTSEIKVLTNREDHKLVIPDGCEIEPPATGPVGTFDLQFVKSEKLKSKGNELDQAILDDEFDETELLEQLNGEEDIQFRVLTASLVDLKRSIKRATIPLWIMSFLLLLILMS